MTVVDGTVVIQGVYQNIDAGGNLLARPVQGVEHHHRRAGLEAGGIGRAWCYLPDDLVRLVHGQTSSQLGAPVLAVGLYDGSTTEMQMKACFSGDCELPSWTSSADDSCSSWVILNREALYIPDLAREKHKRISQFFVDSASERGIEIRSWLGIPLVADGDLDAETPAGCQLVPGPVQ